MCCEGRTGFSEDEKACRAPWGVWGETGFLEDKKACRAPWGVWGDEVPPQKPAAGERA